MLGLANNQTPQALSVHLHITVLQSTPVYLLSQMWTNGKYDSEVGPLTKCKSIGPGWKERKQNTFAQTKAFKYSKLKAKYSLNIVQELRGVDVVKYFGVGQI